MVAVERALFPMERQISGKKSAARFREGQSSGTKV